LFYKFYSHTPLSIVIEVRVLGFSQPFDLLCQRGLPVIIIISTVIDQDPASVSCVFTIRDSPCVQSPCYEPVWISFLF